MSTKRNKSQNNRRVSSKVGIFKKLSIDILISINFKAENKTFYCCCNKKELVIQDCFSDKVHFPRQQTLAAYLNSAYLSAVRV